MDYQCIFCHTRAFEKKIKELPVDSELKKSLVRDFFKYISNMEETKSAPEAAGDMHRLIRNSSHIADPYLEEKEFINNYLVELYPEFKAAVNSSINPFDKALRLSIAGNIIDNIASPDYDIKRTINHVLSSDFRIDHSAFLSEEIQKANTILYLGDNAGEIVLDKLFIASINHPNIIFAVRGAPVINDVTIEDATFVGMENEAKVISNGSDAPSTILTKVSDEFLEIYNNADLIISKGQGNLEGLIHEKSKNIFFLFMVKCDVIAKLIGAEKGDFVVLKNMFIQNPAQTLHV